MMVFLGMYSGSDRPNVSVCVLEVCENYLLGCSNACMTKGMLSITAPHEIKGMES